MPYTHWFSDGHIKHTQGYSHIQPSHSQFGGVDLLPVQTGRGQTTLKPVGAQFTMHSSIATVTNLTREAHPEPDDPANWGVIETFDTTTLW